MCIIIDTNVLADVFNSESKLHMEFAPVVEWILKGKGKNGPGYIPGGRIKIYWWMPISPPYAKKPNEKKGRLLQFIYESFKMGLKNYL